MNKRIFFSTAILIAGLSTFNSALSEVTSVSKNKQSSVCGFRFAAVDELKVAITPISLRALRTRVDNERYEACPYNVAIEYNKISIRVDFGQDINLERLKEAEQYGPVRTAYFRYDENGWGSAGDDINIKKDEISMIETPSGVTVSGVLTRKNQQTGKEDFCFSVVAIGKDKYATGAACGIEKYRLYKIRDFFDKKPIIFVDQ